MRHLHESYTASTAFADMREMIDARRLEIAEGTEFNDLFGILIKSSDQEEGASALSEREMLSNIYVMLLAGACPANFASPH